jgi:hypothetical protein
MAVSSPRDHPRTTHHLLPACLLALLARYLACPMSCSQEVGSPSIESSFEGSLLSEKNWRRVLDVGVNIATLPENDP